MGLTLGGRSKKYALVQIQPHSFCVLTAFFLFGGTALAAVPFDSATVTRLQNEVVVGGQGGANTRPAQVSETVKQDEYVRTAAKSRAELQFKDESFVRIGQNTVFTFEGGSRTVSLKKGALLFYVKPGSGGGTIETPALTAAITGTVGLAYVEGGISYLAVIHGELQTKFGPIGPGQKMDEQGNITEFDIEEVKKGRLYSFGGVIPDFGAFTATQIATQSIPDFGNVPRFFDLLEITQLNPAVREFLNTPIIRPEKKIEVKKPTPQPPAGDPPPTDQPTTVVPPASSQPVTYGG